MIDRLERPLAPEPYSLLPELPGLTVTSDDITHGDPLKLDQVYSEGNTSPQLSWEGAPEGTKSFVVTCFDPDAPTPSGFWHWIVVDIPGDVTSLPAGAGSGDEALPGNAFHCITDMGAKAYGGCAPPEGDRPHRYYFAVHAVGEDRLGVDSDSTGAVVSFNLVFKGLARGAIMGTHQA